MKRSKTLKPKKITKTQVRQSYTMKYLGEVEKTKEISC